MAGTPSFAACWAWGRSAVVAAQEPCPVYSSGRRPRNTVRVPDAGLDSASVGREISKLFGPPMQRLRLCQHEATMFWAVRSGLNADVARRIADAAFGAASSAPTRHGVGKQWGTVIRLRSEHALPRALTARAARQQQKAVASAVRLAVAAAATSITSIVYTCVRGTNGAPADIEIGVIRQPHVPNDPTGEHVCAHCKIPGAHGPGKCPDLWHDPVGRTASTAITRALSGNPFAEDVTDGIRNVQRDLGRRRILGHTSGLTFAAAAAGTATTAHSGDQQLQSAAHAVMHRLQRTERACKDACKRLRLAGGWGAWHITTAEVRALPQPTRAAPSSKGVCRTGDHVDGRFAHRSLVWSLPAGALTDANLLRRLRWFEGKTTGGFIECDTAARATMGLSTAADMRAVEPRVLRIRICGARGSGHAPHEVQIDQRATAADLIEAINTRATVQRVSLVCQTAPSAQSAVPPDRSLVKVVPTMAAAGHAAVTPAAKLLSCEAWGQRTRILQARYPRLLAVSAVADATGPGAALALSLVGVLSGPPRDYARPAVLAPYSKRLPTWSNAFTVFGPGKKSKRPRRA